MHPPSSDVRGATDVIEDNEAAVAGAEFESGMAVAGSRVDARRLNHKRPSGSARA